MNKLHDQQHSKEIFLTYSSGTVILKLVRTVILKLVIALDHLEIVRMADLFWKSMPAALKSSTLDELYGRLRALNYTQVDEMLAVMLNAILQLEEQGESRKSATEDVLMVGYTTEGISNQEQTRWLSWNVDGGVRGFDLARNPGLSKNTEYGAGEFPRSAVQFTSKPPSMMRAQQTEETYPDLSKLKRELERAQREKNKANLIRDSAKLERDQANLERDQAIFESDQARRDLDMMKAEYQQEQRVRENEANCEQLKSELEKIQRRQREFDRQKEKGTRTAERAAAGSRPESRMEVNEAPRSKGRFNLDRAAQERHKRGTGSVDTNRISVPPTWFGDTTDTPTDGRGTVGIYPELNPEQQSGERELVASQGIK